MTKSKAESFEVIVFSIWSENYALECSYVKEVYPLKTYTPLTLVPRFVLGLVNVRRRVFSLVDLAVIFDLKPSPNAKGNQMLIVENREMSFALLTHKILGIETVDANEVQAVPSSLLGLRKELTKGVTADGLILLNGQALLSSNQLVVNEAING